MHIWVYSKVPELLLPRINKCEHKVDIPSDPLSQMMLFSCTCMCLTCVTKITSRVSRDPKRDEHVTQVRLPRGTKVV